MDPILFGPFCLDINQRRFFREGTDLKLRPQAVRVLRVLLQKAGQSVLLTNSSRRPGNRPLKELMPQEARFGMAPVKAVKA